MADYQSNVPLNVDKAVHIYTFQDVVERLLDLFNVERTDPRALRMCKEAAMTSFRELINRRRWTCYERRGVLSTTAAVITGTVSYDHSGGTYERQLTFTETLPSWALYGRVRIGNVDYIIESVKSSTVLTLSQYSNPGVDVTNSTYQLWQGVYSLPVDVKTIVAIFDTTDKRQVVAIPMRFLQRNQVCLFNNPNATYEVVVRNDEHRYGALAIEFSSVPLSPRYYDYSYIATPRELAIEKYSQGTVTVAGGSTTVTLTGGSFPEDCAGSVIRFSRNSTYEPTGFAGNADGTDNRYTDARIIQSRTSSTQVTIDTSIDSSAVTAVKYTVSDPLDLNPTIMLNAFYALAEAECAKRFRDDKDWQRYFAQAQREVERAQCADEVADRGSIPLSIWRNRGPVDMSGMGGYTQY